MGLLAALERWFAERIEGGFARLFRSGLHPAAVAEAVAEAARAGCQGGDGPPNRFSVRLHPSDLAALSGRAAEVAAAAVARAEAALAVERCSPRGRLQVILAADDSVKTGELRIVSEVSAGPGAAELVGADGRAVLCCDGRLVTIGRGPDCDLVLDSQDVSRRHARLEPVELEWIVVDLESTNGTTVNDAPVTRLPVRDGDRLGFGPIRLWFREL